jgi:heat shock protein HslJ
MRESEHECDDVAQLNRWACPCRILLCRARRDGGYAAGEGTAEAFPFGRELLLDVAPLRGSKKVPILDVGDGGSAEIELWCNAVKAQLIVAGDTITIITREASARQCAPERARADEDLLAALSEITNWRMEPSALVLTGGSRTLRFRTQTN